LVPSCLPSTAPMAGRLALLASQEDLGTCLADDGEALNGAGMPHLQCLLQRRDSRETVHGGIAEDDLDDSGAPAELTPAVATACDPAFSGFSCVTGFTVGACRTAAWGAGLENTDFQRVTSTGPSDCASQCAARADCHGFEAAPSSTHCEIWLTAPGKTSSAAPWICRAKVPGRVDDGCGDQTGFAGFTCISGFEKGACRTASLGTGTTPGDYELVSASSADDCATQCTARGDCVAFESSASGSRCELWKSPPSKSSLADGWMCRLKRPIDDGCGGQTSFAGFSCLSGFEKGACRTASLGAGVVPGDYELATATSADNCAAQCAGRPDCVAFESSATGSRCEIWKTTPAKSSLTDGWVCRIKAGGLIRTSPTTTTATTTTTKTTTPTTTIGGATQRIQIAGTQLLVDGAPVHLKGVNWSPVKKGGTSPWGLDFAGTVEQDSSMMQSAGVNSIRTYEPLLDRAVLDKLWSRGIYVLNTVYAWGGEVVDRLVPRVNAVKDHPAILMWVIGNEWNYNGFYYGLSHDTSIARIRAAAQLIKQHDTAHPVSTIYGEVPSVATLQALSDVDIWGINVYRGGGFGDLFSVWSGRSQKPMYLGEYGADAWNANSGALDESAQAYATTTLTQAIVAQSTKWAGPCLGGIIFEFNDEWWKDGAGSHWVHDVGGVAPGGGPYPDYTFNEEWWGLVDIDRNPRQAFHAYAGVASP